MPTMVAGASAGLLWMPLIVTPAPALADDAPFYVMGGSGLSDPTDLIGKLQSLWFPMSTQPHFTDQPTFDNVHPQALITPENFYPFTGIHSDTLATSVREGVEKLDEQLSKLGDGEAAYVFGESQSAVIASLEMEQLNPDANVTFVLAGDLMNPNGGLLSRFEGLNLAPLGIDFYGSTPDSDFTTIVYTIEYDGYADFPKYPLNILSDLNALAGLNFVHGDINTFNQSDLVDAIRLTTSGTTDTTYFIIPIDDLPLLEPLRGIPVIGDPIADLLQPDLTYMVNLGYGDPEFGYSTSPANEPTPFGLFPDLNEIAKMPGLLLSGAQKGIEDFIGDFTGTGPHPIDLSTSSLADASSGSTGTLPDFGAALQSVVNDPGSAITDLANTLSSDLQTAYGVLLPTADIVNSLLTSLSAYDLTLFLDHLSNPIDAIGLPIAADIAIGLYLTNVELDVVGTAAQSILNSFGL